jgi:hypothetical protein
MPVFQVTGKLVPTAAALRSRIHDVESFLAEINAQRPVAMLPRALGCAFTSNW